MAFQNIKNESRVYKNDGIINENAIFNGKQDANFKNIAKRISLELGMVQGSCAPTESTTPLQIYDPHPQ